MEEKKRKRNDDSDELVTSTPEAKKRLKETVIEKLNDTSRLLENELRQLKEKHARSKEENAQDAKILELGKTIGLLRSDISFYHRLMKSPGERAHWHITRDRIEHRDRPRFDRIRNLWI